MEIHFQLTHGGRHMFALKKDIDTSSFLGKLKFWEIFDGRIVRVSNGEFSWTFQPHLIEKIRFSSTPDIHWGAPENVLSGKIISETSYRLKLDKMKQKPGAPGVLHRPGEIVEGLAEMTLASGSVEYLEFTIVLRSPREQTMDLSVIFQRPPFPIPCEEGGFVLFNPVNISMIRICPVTIEACESDWPLDAATESQPDAGDDANVH